MDTDGIGRGEENNEEFEYASDSKRSFEQYD
jgi:hypothetical protein